MVTDAGAETIMHYAFDITRTTPVGGKFSDLQKEIYGIVLKQITKLSRLQDPTDQTKTSTFWHADNSFGDEGDRTDER